MMFVHMCFFFVSFNKIKLVDGKSTMEECYQNILLHRSKTDIMHELFRVIHRESRVYIFLSLFMSVKMFVEIVYASYNSSSIMCVCVIFREIFYYFYVTIVSECKMHSPKMAFFQREVFFAIWFPRNTESDKSPNHTCLYVNTQSLQFSQLICCFVVFFLFIFYLVVTVDVTKRNIRQS